MRALRRAAAADYDRAAMTRDEPRQLLPQLLREDPAFREELFGLLAGKLATKDDIAKILEELRRQREDADRRFAAFERGLDEQARTTAEHSRVLQEHSRVIEQHSRTIEELVRRSEEHSRVIAGHSRGIEQHGRAIEEHSRVIQEHSRSIERLVAAVQALAARLDRSVEGLGRRIDALGTRSGMLAEGSFRAPCASSSPRTWASRPAGGSGPTPPGRSSATRATSSRTSWSATVPRSSSRSRPG
ncbi:MAG: hypothetical protein KatS3mg102_1010 [Planctomycetota bacterium]|nr:MAG: hypothetical protein KatS3mg102_1010 [Planctomycetota bacterium]